MAVQELLIRLGLDNANFNKKMRGVSKEIDILEANYKAISNSVKNFEGTQDGLAKKMAHIKDVLSMVDKALEMCDKEFKELHGTMQKCEGEISEFNSKISKSSEAIAKTEKKLESATAVTQKFQKNVNELKSIKETFDKSAQAIEKHEKNIKYCEEEYKKLSQTLEKNKSKIIQLKEANEKLTNTMVNGAKSIFELEMKYNKNKIALEKLGAEYKKLSQEFGENSKQAQSVKMAMENLEKENKEVASSLEKVKNGISQATKKFEENGKAISKLKGDNEKLVERLKDLKKQIFDNQKAIEKEKESYKKLSEELKKYGIEAKSLKEAKEKVVKAIEKEERALKNATQAQEKHKEKLKELRKEEEGLTQQLDKSQRQLNRTKQAMQELELKTASLVGKQKELNRTLKETAIDKQLVKLKETGKQYTELGNTMKAMGSKVEGIGKTLTYGVSMPLVGLGTVAGKTFMDFEQQMRKVNAVMQDSSMSMEAKYKKLSDSARYWGQKTEWSSREVGQAYEYMAMAGWGVEQSTDAIHGLLNLASISMIDLGRASDIVTDTMTPFQRQLDKLAGDAKKANKNFNGANYMVDIFAQTAASSNTNVELMGQTIQYAGGAVAGMGGRFEDLAIAIGTCANAGIKGTKAGTGLAMGLSRLNAPTDAGAKAMKKLGIELKKTGDGNLDLLGTMNSLRAGFAKLDPVQKDAIAKDIFGQNAKKAWLPIINAQTDAWDNLTKAIYNSEGASDKMMNEIQNSGAYQFKELSSAVEELLITIGDALAPAIKDVTKKITDMTNNLTAWIKKMRETNPQLLSLVGKLAMVAVAVPPVLAGFGMITKGMGSLFSTTGSAISGFVNFKKSALSVAQGVEVTSGKMGFLAQGVGKLVGCFGVAPVAIGGAVVALTGLMAVVGSNENALGWLIDKWGGFGEFIAGLCEEVYGTVKLTIGNLIILIGGLGKAIGKLLAGEWTQIDDVMAETVSKMAINTKEACSDMARESTHALVSLKEATKEELSQIQNTFTTTQKQLDVVFKGGVEGLDENTRALAGTFYKMNDKMLEIFRGTSDSMAVMLSGISKDMNFNDVEWTLKQNLKSMIESGKYSSEQISEDFKKASQLINQNFGQSLAQIKSETSKFTDDISKLGARGYQNVADNIENHMNHMSKQTFNHIKEMGGTWKQLFDGVEQNSDGANTAIINNLKKMGGDTGKIIEALNNEVKAGMSDVKLSAEETQKETEQSANKVASSMAKMVNEVGKANSKSLKKSSGTIVNALKEMDSKSLVQLKKTSSEWSTILDGAMDKNGKLVGNFKDTVIGNLNWVATQSPEKMKGFTNGILQALVKNNILTQEQMEAFKKNVDANVTGAGKSAEESVKTINGNIANMMKALNDQSSINLGQLQNTIVTALGSLNKESIVKLTSTSNQWKEILKGAVSDGGVLSGDYKKVILDNLTKITKESPEKMNEYKKGLLQALVGANIITQEQMDAFQKTVSEKTSQAKNDSKGAGDQIAENVAPKTAQQKTQEELNKVNETIQSKTADLQKSSQDAGAKSTDAFATEVNKVKEKVKINDSIINIQELENQMKGAGTLAITAFAEGWVQNTNILVNGINTSITQANSTVTNTITGLNTVIDGVATKMAIVSDSANDVKSKMEALNNTGLGNLKGNVDNLVSSLGNVSSKADDAKGKIVALANTQEVASMPSNVQSVIDKIINLGTEATKSANDVRILASTSLDKLNSALKDCISRFKDIKDNADKVKTSFDKIIAQSFSKIDRELNDINNKLKTAKERADSAKSAIQNINNISMSNAINQLYSLCNWLQAVRRDANSTASALENVNNKRSFVGKIMDGIGSLFSARAVKQEVSMAPVMGAFATIQAPVMNQDSLDITNYKTSGGYYSPSSVVGKTAESRSYNSQSETIELLKRNQEILMQILLAEKEINVDLSVDSKQIAKATAREMNKEITLINKRKERLGGRF